MIYKINHDKSEIILLGNCSSTLEQDNAVSCNLKIKKVVQILGVHFTYDLRAKQKLNVDELQSDLYQKSGRLAEVGRLTEVQCKLDRKGSKHDFIASIQQIAVKK